MAAKRFCVFCGRLPVGKNREHILPYWLLEMTGNPARVVRLGTDFENQKDIRFSWSSFVMPSCEICNSSFSDLENKAKGIVERLVRREAIQAGAYVTLLDWLDKVRVGLWLAYHVLQKLPFQLEPSFHIGSRIGTKDRFVAVYPIGTNNRGLNAYGVESFLFNRTPSCFGLRVNDLFLINLSGDFLFSERCGFPAPRIRNLFLDGPNQGMLGLEKIVFTRRIKHPILRRRLHKPSVLIYQPVMLQLADETFFGDDSTFDSFLGSHTIGPYLSGKGALFRQRVDSVEVVTNPSQEIHFDLITGRECRPSSDLIAQVYELQNYVQGIYKPFANDPKQIVQYRRMTKELRASNRRVIKYLRGLSSSKKKGT